MVASCGSQESMRCLNDNSYDKGKCTEVRCPAAADLTSRRAADLPPSRSPAVLPSSALLLFLWTMSDGLLTFFNSIETARRPG